MTERRPDPDELLRRVQAEELRERRGKLTVFFGAAPGVGKTYAMLREAIREQELGSDVLVGVLETHGRAETEALLQGLALLPRRPVDHRGVTLSEFDLDGALARHPRLILVDELAHTNAEGSRHPKRWQDVAELLDAGINVHTTLNVQHLESLSEIIAVGMGLVVRETVPDSVLEMADEVRLIDLPPGELLERLAEGRIYIPEQAERARDNFFRKENLHALRELALRQTAERVGTQARQYQEHRGLKRTWTVSERLLVCLSESPDADKVLWAASGLVMRMHVPWAVLHVESPGNVRLPEARRQELVKRLRHAEQLGAEVSTVSGMNAADEILKFASEWGATRIVVGPPGRRLLPWRITGSVVADLMDRAVEQDIWVTRNPRSPAPRRFRLEFQARRGRGTPAQYVVAVATMAAVTAITSLLFGRGRAADVVMLYLLGVALVAMRCGYGPSLLAALLGVLAFDFFFVPPYLSFAFSDLGHVITFGILLFVALVISNLTDRIRAQVEASRAREKRIATQYALSRELARTTGRDGLIAVSIVHIEDTFDCRAMLLLPDAVGRLAVAGPSRSEVLPSHDEGIVQWVWQNRREAGLATDTLPGSEGLYLVVSGTQGAMGVLCVIPKDRHQFEDTEQRRLLDTFVSLTAIALERARLAEESQLTRGELEKEGLRNTLLASISHDLRTPIAVIMGAASALMDDSDRLDAGARMDLVQTVYGQSVRLNRLVRDLLDMTRLESGGVQLTLEWHSVEEIVGASLNRLEDLLGSREVRVELEPGLPLIRVDGVLIGQLLVNLLENAVKYSPRDAPIEISASKPGDEVLLEVADRGPGIPEADLDRVFDKFYRGSQERLPEGVGLGLAICRAIAVAHGGRMLALNRPGGGASFRCAVPAGELSPGFDPPASETSEE